MVYNYTSSKEVIAKIYSDLDIQEESHRITDIREWVAEAITKIGAVNQFLKKVTVIPVNNYQAAMPSDLYNLNQAAYSFYNGEYWIPMRAATGSFDTWGCNCTTNTSTEDIIMNDKVLVDLVKSLYKDYVGGTMDYATALAIVNTDDNVKSILKNLLNNTSNNANGANSLKTDYEAVYIIKPGYIVTNMQTGYIKLSYTALPLDEDGFPMIPDLPSYFEAIYWYVAQKLQYPEYRQGRLPQHIYYDTRRSWNFYCKQAYGDALMPNKDELESIKNQWNRLVPEQSEHSQFFTMSGRAQQIYNHN